MAEAKKLKETIEKDNVPSRVLPEKSSDSATIVYRVLIPEDRKHVLEEFQRRKKGSDAA